MKNHRLQRSDVEKKTIKDIVHKGAEIGSQLGASFLPASELQFGANVLASVLFALLRNPMEERRNEWIEQIEADVYKLNQRYDNLEKCIRDNENVLSTVIMASQLAMKTCNKEKLQALRNIIMNTIMQPDYEEYKLQMFLNMIEKFTEWHIRLLDYFSRPEELQKEHKIVIKSGQFNSQPAMQVFWSLYPKMKTQKEYIKVIMENLFTDGLISVDGKFIDVIYQYNPPIGIYNEECGPLAKRTTDLGDELLKLIREYEE